ASASTRKIPLSRILLTLVRRELWEHRTLWAVPLGLSVLIFLSALLTHFTVDGRSMRFEPFPWSSPAAVELTDNRSVGVAMLTLWEWAMSIPLFVAVTIVVYFYLLQCLFDERKDRSILFWKSLPVSDGTTVASKLLVALVVVPFGA